MLLFVTGYRNRGGGGEGHPSTIIAVDQREQDRQESKRVNIDRLS